MRSADKAEDEIHPAEDEADSGDGEADQCGKPERIGRVTEQDRQHQPGDPQEAVIARTDRPLLVSYRNVRSVARVQQSLAGNVRVRGSRSADAVDDVPAQNSEVRDGEILWLPEDSPVDHCNDLATEPAVPGRLLVLELPEDDVISVHCLIDENQSLVRRVLQIIIHGDDVIA